MTLATTQEPGAWTFGDNKLAVPNRYVTQADGKIIAYCDGSLEEAKTHGPLIAAAPRLLKALRNILKVLEPTDHAKFRAVDKQNRIATAQVLGT